MTAVATPLTYPGNKRWAADAIWSRLGDDLDVYCEPFAGSLAAMLAAPRAARREVICDADHLITNCWRSIQRDPGAVAAAAAWPNHDAELWSRIAAIRQWVKGDAARVAEDPAAHDAQIAGWWLRAQQLTIGGASAWGPRRKRQRMPDSPNPIRPPHIDHLRAVADRLACAIVLAGDWRGAVTRTVLCSTASKRGRYRVGVLLDPPYAATPTYRIHSPAVAERAWRWAVRHGHEYRIAYCCSGDPEELPAFIGDLSDGWSVEAFRRRRVRSSTSEFLLFSPATLSL